MSRRPGEQPMPGCANCFLVIFFVPFAAVGIGVLREGLKQWQRGAMPAGVVMTLIGGVFAAVGLGGIAWMLYRFFTRRQANGPMKKPKPVPPGWQQNPWFPPLPGRATSRHGRISISPQSSNWGKFWGMLFMTVFWNGLSWTGFIAILRDAREGKWPVFFVGLFVLIGLGLLIATVKQFLRAVMVGETTAELDAEPLAPGQQSRVSLYQRGSFTAQQLDVSLVAQEVVTYGSGTDRTTHRETVHEETILTRPDVRVQAEHAIAQVEFKVPEDAAPSFKSSNNELAWSIRVKMIIAGRPDVDEYFPFRVAPEAGAVR
jgi:hypothetical protein